MKQDLTDTQIGAASAKGCSDSQLIRQLGNYTLLKKLGEGGMGAVYLAEDVAVQRKVALKVLPLDHAGNANSVSRFKSEAKAIGKLNHPNIIQAYNIDQDQGYHFYAMEFCEGQPLDAVLRSAHHFPVEKALDYIRQAALGLQHAHDHSIIHRDMKPANLFLTADGVVKILDLGLAKNIEDGNRSFVTDDGSILGTPLYIAPEQAMGEKKIDGRADIYSLGATFYHFVTGRTPFEGKNVAIVLSKHLREQLVNPIDIQPDIPETVVQVIQRMMAKAPSDRYQNCAELLEDLEKIIEGVAPASPAIDPKLSSVLPRTNILTAVESAIQITPETEPEAAHVSVESRPAQRSWAIFAAGAAVVLTSLMGLAVVRGRSAPPAISAAPAIPTVAPAAHKTDEVRPEISVTEKPAVIPAATLAPAVEKNSQTAPLPAGPVVETTLPAQPAPAVQTIAVAPAVVETPSVSPQPAVENSKTTSAEAPREISQDVHRQMAQLLTQNHYSEATDLLERRQKESPAESAAIAREKAAIATVRAVREKAIEAVRQMSGKSVTLKFAGTDVSGTVGSETPRGVMIKLKDGPEMQLTPELLDPADADKYAPALPDRAENLRARGLLYLAAGKLDSAKFYLSSAATAGAANVIPYLERIPVARPSTAPAVATPKSDPALKVEENLLTKLDPLKAPQGVKLQNGTLLASDSAQGWIDMPANVPAEYDCRVEFSCESNSGGLMILIPHAGRSIGWMLEIKARSCKLGNAATGPQNAVPFDTKTGTKHKVTFEVRKDSVRVFADDNHDKPIQELTAEDFHNNAPRAPGMMREATQISLGSKNASVNFYGVYLHEAQASSRTPAAKPERNELPYPRR